MRFCRQFIFIPNRSISSLSKGFLPLYRGQKPIICIQRVLFINLQQYNGKLLQQNMQIGDFLQRQKELLVSFRHGGSKKAPGTTSSISWYKFHSEGSGNFRNETDSLLVSDAHIRENFRFTYPVFIPEKRKNNTSCILLLHGLNERSWDKYLLWAEHLAQNTGKPVILFPIAYHINRGPSAWGNPRSMSILLEKRKREAGNPGSLSLANVALSNRLSENPFRFYGSGEQTIKDIIRLSREITGGKHPLFEKGTIIDIFGYSIGSFLAEVMLMANPENLFSASRLFIFCGGSIFKNMYGESKYIMDHQAYERLLNYYCNEWPQATGKESKQKPFTESIRDAFNAMIAPEFHKDERERFFMNWKNRIRGISLKKDKVMPFEGVKACMGSQLAGECFELVDFPFEYSHEAPFPLNGKVEDNTLRSAFLTVFTKCAAFLA